MKPVRTAIVGYLDLLGFSQNIMMVEGLAGAISTKQLNFEIRKDVSEQYVLSRRNLNVTISWASDSFVAYHMLEGTEQKNEAMKRISSGVAYIAEALGITQCVFASGAFFSRGGIAIGDLVGSPGDEAFGSGLVRAVEIEKSLAEDPKVCLSGKLAGIGLKLKAHTSGRGIFLLDMPLPSLDYLSFSEEASDFGARPNHLLGCHAASVHDFAVIASKRPELKDKAKWLLQYHNWHVKSRGDLERLIVDIEL